MRSIAFRKSCVSGAALRRPLAALLVWLVLVMQCAALPTSAQDYDLRSRERSIVAGEHHEFEQAQLDVGGKTRTVTPADTLTAAELVALTQVLTSGQQTIRLGDRGNAVGGTVDIAAHLGNSITSLVIPKHVIAFQDFGTAGALNITGNLTNAGHFYAASTNASTVDALISAATVTNKQGAVLSSVLPPSGLPGMQNAIQSLNLTLRAQNDIINSGTITSSGSLSAIAGGSIINALPGGASGPAPLMQAINSVNFVSGAGNIVNSGLISSISNNINITSQVAKDLIINNIGGRLEALAGSINVRDALFADKGHLVFWGGDVLARETNLYSGTGIVNMNVSKLLGTLNIWGGEAHVTSATDSLKLGTISLAGDPTFYNTAGNVEINSDLIFSGAPLTIVASGDIITAIGAMTIDTSSSSGNGGDILLVAGADFTSDGPSSVVPPAPGDTTSTLTITGGLATGGKIDLTAGAPITTFRSGSTGGDGSGGRITLIAYGGTNSGAGTITLPSSLTLESSGNGTGSNGDVLIVAGATSGTAISLGDIDSNNGTAGGSVTIATATPAITGGTGTGCPPCVTVKDGAITSGAFGVGATKDAAVTVGTIAAGGAVSITGGSSLSATEITTSNAPVSLVTDSLSITTGMDAGTSTVTLAPHNEIAIAVAGTSAGALVISSALLSAITASSLTIGDINKGGGITILGNINVPATGPGAYDLTFTNDDNFNANSNTLDHGSHDLTITVNGNISTGAITGDDLTLTAGGTMTTGGNLVAGGNIDLSAGGPIQTNGKLTADGNISLETTTSNSSITIGDTIRAKGSVTINATGSILAPNQAKGTITSSGAPWEFLLGATLNKDGTRLYVPDFNLGIVAIIDTATNTQIGTVTGLNQPQATAINSTGNLLYVGNLQGKSVSIFNVSNPASPTLVATVNIGSNVEAVALSKDGTKLYVLSDINSNFGVAGEAVFTVVDVSTPSTPAVLSTLNLGTNRAQTGGIALSADGTLAYVSNSGTRNVFVVNLATNSVLTTVNLSSIGGASPQDPMFLAIDPNGTRVYVSEAFTSGGLYAGSISIIDANPDSSTFNSLITNVPLGQGGFNAGGRFPQGIAVSPTNTEVFAQVTYDSFLSVLSTASLQVESVATGQGPDGFGSSRFSGIVMRDSVPTVVTYTSNTINLTGPNTISVVVKPTIQSGTGSVQGNITLTAIGNINANYDAMGGTISAQSTSGSVFLGNVGTAASAVGTSSANSASGTFQIGSLGAITTTGNIQAANVVIETTAGDRSITLNSNVGLSTGSVRITANGAGNVTGTGTIAGSSVSVLSQTGNIDIITAAGGLTVNTGGANVEVDNTGDLNLGQSSAGTSLSVASQGSISTSGAIAAPNVTLTTTAPGSANIIIGSVVGFNGGTVDISAGGIGSIIVSGAGSLVGNNLTLTTQDGNITLSGNLGNANATVVIDAGGTGDILQSTGSISGLTVTLSADAGDIGTTLLPINIATSTFTANSTAGSVFLSHTGALTLGAGNGAGVTFQLTNAGLLTIGANVSAPQIDLRTTNNNNIAVSATIGATSAGTVTTLNAGGKGNIVQASPGALVRGATVNLLSGTGNIGSPVNNIRTSATNLSITTSTSGGNAYVTETDAVTLQTSSVGATSTSSALRLTANGQITITGTVTAPSLTLQTTGSNNIQIAANVGSPTGVTTILTGGSGNISTVGLFNVQGASVVLASTTGDIGTMATPVRTAGTNLSANTGAGGNVFISHQGAVTLGTGSAGSTFQVTAAGNITTTSTLSASAVTLQATSNGNINMNTSLGKPGGSVSLIVGGAGSIIQAASASFLGNTVNLTTGSSNIGSAAAPLRVPTGALTVSTAGSAFITTTGDINIGTTNAGAVFEVTAAGSITTSGAITAGSITLQTASTSNGDITIGANLNGVTVIRANGTGDIFWTGGTITGTTVTLTTFSGDIGSSSSALQTSATNLTANSNNTSSLTSKIFLNNVGVSLLTLGASKASGTFEFKSAGPITVSGVVTANNVTIESTGSNGTITLNADVGKSAKAPAVTSTTIKAGGIGQIAQTAGSVIGTNISLITGTGGTIGSSVSPVKTIGTNLTINTGGAGSAFVANTGATNLGASTIGGTLQLTSTGNLTVTGNVTVSSNLTLQTTAGTLVHLGANVAASLSATITGGSKTVVTQAPGALLTGTTVTITAGATGIGSAVAPIRTSATTLVISTPGSAFISEANAVSLGASTASKSFELTAAGPITVSGTLASPVVKLTTADLSNGGISIQANIGTGAGAITIQADGLGSISRFAGTVLGTTVTLTSEQGSIGTSSPAGNIHTSANTLQATTDGAGASIFITNDKAVIIAASKAGHTLQFTAAGNITANSLIDADSVTLKTTNNGNIAMGVDLGKPGGTVSFLAAGTGIITQAAGANFLGNTINLSSDTGNIGTSTVPIIIPAGTTVSANTGTGGNVFLTAAGNITLSSSGAGGTFRVATTNNGSITVAGTVGATTGTTILVAGGTGGISHLSGLVRGSSVVLSTASGSVGTSVTPLQTQATSLTATTGAGSSGIFLSNSGSVNVNASSTPGTFQLIASGNVSLAGNLSANVITLQTTANGNINLGNAVVQTTGTGSPAISILAGGTGAITQGTAGSIVTPALVLSSGGNSIGSAATNIKTATLTLTVNTSGAGSVFVTNTSPAAATLTLNASSAGPTFQLTQSGSLTIVGNVTASNVTLQTTPASNGNIAINNGNANIGQVGSASTTLRAGGSGNITQASGSGSIGGLVVSISSGTGNLGTAGNNLRTAATTLSVNTAGNGGVFVQQTGAVTLNSSGAGTGFSLTGTDDMTVGGVATFNGSITLKNNGNLVVQGGANISATGGQLTLQNQDTASGSIVIGAGATLSASSGNILIFIGTSEPAPNNPTEPANVDVFASNGGQVFFGVGTNTITANAPDNEIRVNGQDVKFDTGSLGASAITLNGGVMITASQFPLLTSLDMTDPATRTLVSDLIAQGVIVGTLTDFTVDPSDLAGRLSAANIPMGTTVRFQDFQLNNEIKVVITDTSTTRQALISGAVIFQHTNPNPVSNGVLNISSTQAGPVLVLSSSGSITSDGSVTVTGNGSMTFNGAVTPGANGNVTLQTSASSNGSISLGATVGAAGSSNITTIIADGTGNISRTAGTILGATINLASSSGNIGSSLAPINTASTTLLTANTGGTGSVFLQNIPNSGTAQPTLIGTCTAGDVFSVRASGSIQVTGTINTQFLSSNSISLVAGTAGGNHSIDINADIFSSLGLTLVATGSGTVRTPASGRVMCAFGFVSISTGTGDIGTQATPLKTNAGNLSVTTGVTGSVFVDKQFSNEVVITGITAGNNIVVRSSGPIRTTGAVRANTVHLETLSDSLSDENISIGADAGRAGGTTTIIAAAAGNITQTAGTTGRILGATISLSSTSGSIGTSNSALLPTVATTSLTANTSGSVFILNTGSVTLGASSAGQTFLVAATGNVTTTAPINGGVSLGLQSIGTSGAVLLNDNVSATTNATFTASGNISQAAGKTISITSGGGTVTFNSTMGSIGSTGAGDIDITAAGPTTITAITGGSGVFLNKLGTGSVTLSESRAVSTFQLTSAGSVSVTGPVTAANVTLQASDGSNAGFALGGNIGSTTGTTTISADGTGNITRTNGSLLGSSVVLSTENGSIGTNASPIQTTSARISANTGGSGNVFVNSTGTVTLLASVGGGSGGTFRVQTLNNGSLTIGGNVGAAGANVTLAANGTGSITRAVGNFTVTGDSVTLTSGTGSLGTVTAPLQTSASSLSANTAGTTASLFVDNTGTGPLTIGASTAGSTLQIRSNGAITTSGALIATVTTLRAQEGNSDVTIGADIGKVGGTTTIAASGLGNITQTGGDILGATATLSSGGGDIGSLASPIQTSASRILFSTTGGGDVFVEAPAAVNLGPSSGGATGTFQLTAPGVITVSGAIGGGTVTLQTLNNSNVVLATGALVGSLGSTVTILADGSGNITQIATTTTVQGGSVNFITSTGNIGTSAQPIRTAATNLIANTASQSGMLGSVVISNSGAVSVDNSGAGSLFSVTATGNLTIGDVTAGNGSVSLVSTLGNVGVMAGSQVTAGNGDLLIQTNNATTGTVQIGQNAAVSAISPVPGQGNVRIFIGPAPKTPIAGTTPANVTPVVSGGGQIFYGTGTVTAIAPTNTITAKGANVIFNGRAGSVSLAGGVSILADPPTGSALVPVVEQRALPAPSGPTAHVVPIVPAKASAVAARTGPRLAVPEAAALSSAPAGFSAIAPTDVTASIGNHGALGHDPMQEFRGEDACYDNTEVINDAEDPYRPIAFVSLAPAVGASAGGDETVRFAKDDNGNAWYDSKDSQNDSKWVKDGNIEARNSSSAGQNYTRAGRFASRGVAVGTAAGQNDSSEERSRAAGRPGSGPVVTNSATAEIRYVGSASGVRVQGGEVYASRGETLLWCSKETTVRAGDCTIHIRAGTVAIVLHEGAVVKVRNLWESRAHSIRVLVGNRSTDIAAGHEVVVGRNDGSLAQSLQKDRAGRRGVDLVALEGEKRLVRGEVSLVSLLQTSGVLKHVLGGSNAADRALAGKVMKMAACLMQLTAQRGIYARLNPAALGLKRG